MFVEHQLKDQTAVFFYNVDLEKNHEWVTKCSNDESMARCSLCKSNFSISFDGVGTLTSHSNSNKNKQAMKSVSATKLMHTFFNLQGSSQCDKVTVAELTHIYHSVKRHISYLALDCSAK